MYELNCPRFLLMSPVSSKKEMVAGVVFQPISFQTLLEHLWQYPCNPFCNMEEGCNQKIAKAMGIMSKLQA